MNAGRPLAGAASGLLLAGILIAGVSIAGGGSLHLDLAKTSNNAAESDGASVQSGEPGGTAIAPQTGVQTTQAASASPGARSPSSINSLEGQTGGSIGLLLLPVALGAVLGAVFYVAYNRRIGAE